MEALLLGIAGLTATVISSGLGLYFTSKARVDPHRELLYARQVELVVDIIATIGKVRVYTPMIIERGEWEERAVDGFRPVVKRMAELSDLSAALLPTLLYAEVNHLSRLVTDFLVAYDKGGSMPEFPEKLAGRSAKAALLARTYLGVDELSEETAKLAKGKVAKVADVSPEEIVAMVRANREEEQS